MGDEKKVRMDGKSLKRLEENFRKLRLSKIEVGIFANKNKAHKDSGSMLTEIGFKNEFGFLVQEGGAIKEAFWVAPRSFLRMPIQTGLHLLVAKMAGSLTKVMWEGKINGWLKKLGIAAEARIDDAFASEGFGTWAPNTAFTIKMKGSDMPLIDTGSLRRSITSRVVEK